MARVAVDTPEDKPLFAGVIEVGRTLQSGAALGSVSFSRRAVAGRRWAAGRQWSCGLRGAARVI